MSLYAEFSIPVTGYPLGSYLENSQEVKVTVDRIVPTGETFHYAWIEGEKHEDFIEMVKTDGRLEGLTIVDALPDRILIRFEWSINDLPIFRFIEESHARVESIRGAREGWTLDIRFPDQASTQAFYDASKDAGIDIELRQIFDSNGLSDENDYGISERQYSTLLLALQEGYFEIPRTVKTSDLAERLGVSEQAISERIRRGLSAILRANDIGSDPATESD